jgi:hypothetical protein
LDANDDKPFDLLTKPTRSKSSKPSDRRSIIMFIMKRHLIITSVWMLSILFCILSITMLYLSPQTTPSTITNTGGLAMWMPMLDEQRDQKRNNKKHTPTKFEPVPKYARKLFWMKFSPHHKLYEPVARALRQRGWSLTRDRRRAHLIWRDQPTTPRGIYSQLQPWQRYNQLYNTERWDDKDALARTMEEYYRGRRPLHSFPESYVLHDPKGLRQFETRLFQLGGRNLPWVLKQPTVNMGQGVQILGPNSKELLGLVQKVKQQQQQSDDHRLIVQQYICNEMTYRRRKFDFRVFWMVASIHEPVLVLYHTQHNYVRIGHAVYDESNFDTTKSHLTTHTFGAQEQKLTWPQFRDFVQAQYDDHLKPQLLKQKGGSDSKIPPLLDPFQNQGGPQPFLHVEQQIKTILAHIVDAYRDITFTTAHGQSTGQNAFALHAADMILDNNFDVFLIEGTDGPGKDEDYDFRIDMHNALFGEMMDIVEFVVAQQEAGLVVDVNAMKEQGILGGYDMIYHDSQRPKQPRWMFDYHYDRLPPKPCGSHSSSNNNDESDDSSPVAIPSKTFYMPGRVHSDGEAVSRSFRRLGYTPVDDVADAQIVYNRVSDKRLKFSQLQPWQFVTPFATEDTFFNEEYLMEHEYLDRTKANGVVCNPLLYNGLPDRRFQIVVYWLVLSTNPLLVLYHDGYMFLPYASHDELEFVSLQHGSGQREAPIWRGSWTSLEQQLQQSATTRRNGSSLPPMDHVRNQMKQSLAAVAKGFYKLASDRSSQRQAPGRYFAVFGAEFEIDQDHNVFLTELHDDHMAGEDQQCIVDLHNKLYGTALGLIERLNVTATTGPDSLDLESVFTPKDLGGYEWLIHPHFEFAYESNDEAKECKAKERLDIAEAPINWERVKRQ